MGINWQFYHWHLEPSSICAIKCPRCPRVEHPDTPWLDKSMTLDFVKKFFTVELLETQVQRVTMCGDVGDPIYCKEFINICRYIKTTNPNIHLFIITNGSYKKSAWWQELADVLNDRDTINFSIDGYNNDTNNLYRINSNFDSILQGINTVRHHNHKVFLNWATIIFQFNQDHLDTIQSLATDLGMDGLQMTKSTKFGSKYGGYGGDNDVLEPRKENISSSYRYERHTINLSGRTQPTSRYMATNHEKYHEIRQQYANQPITPLCEIGNRGIYVNAEGVIFPCSWVSFPYTSLTHGEKTIQWGDSFFARYRDRMNLWNRDFNDIIQDPLWNKCSRGFRDPEKTWVECSQKCSSQIVNENYAVGWETN